MTSLFLDLHLRSACTILPWCWYNVSRRTWGMLLQCKKKNLGHVVSHKGIEVDKAKVNLISNFSPPRTVKEIRSFLGHAGFYKRFIKNFSKIARPLCSLLAKDAPFDFNEECHATFESLKKTLTSTPIIQPPNV